MGGKGTDHFKGADSSGCQSHYRLRLYVTGATGCSLRAMANIQAICREYLEVNTADLKIIDLYHTPRSARAHNILAAPTLVKEQPAPACRIIGDLSKKEQVIRALGLNPDSPLPVHG